jgi:hypothetical protein
MFLDRVIQEHPPEAPAEGEPVKSGVFEVQGPDGSMRLLQRNEKGEITGAAQLRLNEATGRQELATIAGGRAMGFNESVGPLYERLESLGVGRGEHLTTLGKMARRRGAEKAFPREVLEGRVSPTKAAQEAREAQEAFVRAGLEDVLALPTYAVGESEAPAAPFFSQLRKVVEAPKTQARQTGERWRKFLSDPKRGVKSAEMKWTGLDEYLEGRKGEKVTREEIQQFLDENEVVVEETVRGELVPAWQLRYKDGSGRVGGVHASREGAQRAIDEIEASDRMEVVPATEGRMVEGVPTEFAEYQLPGGEGYRELLLRKPVAAPKEGVTTRRYADGRWEAKEEGTNVVRIGATEAEARARLETYMTSRSRTPTRSGAEFTEGHYDEPNVLAHVRFNERTGPKGEKILFIEELQSDWAQKGRRRGFAGEFVPAETRQSPDGTWEVIQGDVVVRRGLDETGARSDVEYINRTSRAPEGVPSAPFVEKTGDWSALAMKRMLKWAADEGFDQVAWTTGEQQAARYDLSKRISRVTFDDNVSGGMALPEMEGPPGRGTLKAYDLNGREVISRHLEDPAELADYIGKEAADKLLNVEASSARDAGLGVRRRELAGARA